MSKLDLQQLQNMAIAELIDFGTQQLIANSDSAKLDTEILLSRALQKPASYLLTWPEKLISEENLSVFIALLTRRIAGEPIAYITGQREFWSLPFFVSPATLIPRPDTEVLVELVLANHANNELSLLDLGTGTGAIALSLASEQQHWRVDAIDYSHEAVALAEKNAQQLTLPQVSIYQSDWFSAVPAGKTFDVIVSNPPYIEEDDHHLSCGDVRYEPKSALVAKDNGLADIKVIAKNAITHFNDTGYLYIEHGFEQARAVKNILNDLGYQQIKTHKDYSQNDRITFGCFIRNNNNN